MLTGQERAQPLLGGKGAHTHHTTEGKEEGGEGGEGGRGGRREGGGRGGRREGGGREGGEGEGFILFTYFPKMLTLRF